MTLRKRRRADQLRVLSDARLAALAAEGDRAAFEALVPRISPPVYALLLRMGADRALAEDMTQEALITAYRRISTYRGDAPIASWGMRIGARLYFKRRQREARLLIMADPESVREEEPVVAPSSGARLDLDRALDQLSAPERLCVSLCHGAGMSHGDIAEAADLPLGTVKSHVTRGLQKLRRLMDTPEDRDRADDGS